MAGHQPDHRLPGLLGYRHVRSDHRNGGRIGDGNLVDTISAGFGILDILTEFGAPNGTASLPFAQNADAEVYAAFANIFSDPRLHTGIGDGTLLPPAGKNARARAEDAPLIFTFTPVIPTQ